MGAAARNQRRLFSAVHRVLSVLVFAVLPGVLTVAVLATAYSKGPFLYDFHGGMYGAGKDVLHRQDPYRPAYLHRQAALKRAGHQPETIIDVPVYPAPAIVAAVPFALLPYRLAGVLFALISIAAVLCGLWLLGVRDWRCQGLAFLSWPVLHGLMLGALTPLLLLGAAVAWRFRARVWPPGIAIAALISAKIFPWPLAVWLLTTRRLRTLVLVAALALVGTIAAWAAIGFDGLADYPRMLSDLSFVSEGVSVSAVAGFIALGLASDLARIAALIAAAGLLLAAWRLSRRVDGDRRAYGLAIIAALVASPIVWPHYLALVFVPIALAAPRLSLLWFAPLLVYAVLAAQTGGRPWIIPIYLAVVTAPVVRLCARAPLAAAKQGSPSLALGPPTRLQLREHASSDRLRRPPAWPSRSTSP
jgi:glycosyl transferase family 87